ncbi:MAG TPA: 3-isopropylmalate dehydrogenase [Candidatus Polarisedimenticolia bacterium]|nr:3-isopropylmalate dehydrogenase [Candidatus Polarisedimenticolia bacterium]
MTAPGSGGALYRVAVIAGDGVGPEVVGAARAVVDAAGQAFGFTVDWTEVLAGGACIDAHGVAITSDGLAVAGAADAVLLGAVGGPKWSDPNAAVRPEQALFALRGGLELFANLRPVRVHPALVPSSPLRRELLEGVDLLIVRELTSGLYFGRPSEERMTGDGRVAVDTLWYTEAEIRRVVRLAFELAGGRRGKLTSVDKANVLATSRLWRKVVDEERTSFPDVQANHQLVDSCAMLLVREPAAFDVLVTENLFGDILSDEAAVIAGSLGMLPSASLGERRTDHGTFGLYEPIHGSAPDLAGRDVANPIGTILSAAMLLRWSLGREDVAVALEAAVAKALDDGYRTGDLVPANGDAGAVNRVGTRAMAAAIAERIGAPIAAGASG